MSNINTSGFPLSPNRRPRIEAAVKDFENGKKTEEAALESAKKEGKFGFKRPSFLTPEQIQAKETVITFTADLTSKQNETIEAKAPCKLTTVGLVNCLAISGVCKMKDGSISAFMMHRSPADYVDFITDIHNLKLKIPFKEMEKVTICIFRRNHHDHYVLTRYGKLSYEKVVSLVEGICRSSFSDPNLTIHIKE